MAAVERCIADAVAADLRSFMVPKLLDGPT